MVGVDRVTVEDLRAYLRILRQGRPLGVRETQRLLGYRSPGKAQRLLERLERAGLVERREDGRYEATGRLPPHMASYVVVKGTVLPRILMYAAYSTVLAAAYTLGAGPPRPVVMVLALLVAPYWLEALLLLRRLGKLSANHESRPA